MSSPLDPSSRHGPEAPHDSPGSRDRVAAIVLAAGHSLRMGQIDKVRVTLKGTPLVAWSIDTFERCSSIDEIIVVTSAENISYIRTLADRRLWTKVKDICLGGDRRQDSAKEGIRQAKGADWIIVHDAARPFVTEDMVVAGLKEARLTGAAIAAVPVSDTVKRVNAGHKIIRTLSRDQLWAIQTPQVFRYAVIWDAHNAVSQDVTDDASLVEINKNDVAVYQGSPLNIKVTGPQDLLLAEAIARIYEDRYRV
ncbi:MAG: 2-C-methyl-D-erythritol 4-phosphate cytidylyltransferase [Dehalococcoidia bacterium]|nr:2-C-methyl-D-erythritol 4-phosphate cytidylyltransferase [Dehalococcoidia bacterium]